MRNDKSAALGARQAAQYDALEQIVEDFGKFDQTSGKDGAHYAPDNPFGAQGLRCENCSFYDGGRQCELVAGDIDPAAICKLWIIDQSLITEPAPMNHANRLPLMQRLTLQNRATPRRFEVKAAADVATVYLYDVIDAFWGVSAADFAKKMSAIKEPTIHLRVNSPGGDVFDARAMVAVIRSHPSTVVAYIDGLAASAASYVALAADEVRIADGAFVMVHNAWTVAMGNAEDLVSTAALLEKVDATIAEDYQRKTGKTLDEVRAWMAAETWFTAQEAKDAGLVDAIEGAAVKDAARWNVSAFANAPKALTAPAERTDESSLRAALERRLRLYEVC